MIFVMSVHKFIYREMLIVRQANLLHNRKMLTKGREKE